jgi:hypothetical protein
MLHFRLTIRLQSIFYFGSYKNMMRLWQSDYKYQFINYIIDKVKTYINKKYVLSNLWTATRQQTRKHTQYHELFFKWLLICCINFYLVFPIPYFKNYLEYDKIISSIHHHFDNVKCLKVIFISLMPQNYLFFRYLFVIISLSEYELIFG